MLLDVAMIWLMVFDANTGRCLVSDHAVIMTLKNKSMPNPGCKALAAVFVGFAVCHEHR